ncbi:MAG: GAF domain-containing sensor histidine kinase, partial [Acetobacteraceae bacterium]
AAEDALADDRIVHLREVYIRPFGIGAMLTAPIRTGQEVLGIVSACSPLRPRTWTAEDKGFMASLADLAAVALEAGRRAQAMSRLAAEKDRAEAASRAKSLLLGTLGHELRTPLNAIIGFAELLRTEELPKADRLEFAGHVIGAGHHLLGVFNAMLDQARVESGALTLAEARVSLPELIDEAAGLVLPEAATRNIRLDRPAPPPGLPALQGDAGRLRQAIANLAANAVKFSPAGGRVELGASFDARLGYRIWVADEGPGMAADDLPRAFEPFRQLDEGLRRRAGGAGLGLPLAKAFVEAHGGTLEVASVPGQGTRMTIVLPATRALRQSEAPGSRGGRWSCGCP